MTNIETRAAQALVEFASNGTFPNEEDVSAAAATTSLITAASGALEDARQIEIKQLSKERAPNVEVWMVNATALHANIEQSRKLANDIVRQAEAHDSNLEEIEEREAHTTFLTKEVKFNAELGETLQAIKDVSTRLNQAHKQAEEQRFVEALQTLEDIYKAIDAIPVAPQAVQLLYRQHKDKKDHVFECFKTTWQDLIHFDVNASSLTLRSSLSANATGHTATIDDAIILLQSYNKLDDFAVQLWQDVDRVVLQPRTVVQNSAPHVLEFRHNVVALSTSTTDQSLSLLLNDLHSIMQLFARNLPDKIRIPFANVMMPILSTRVKEEWLDKSVPTSLENLNEYQSTLALVDGFADNLQEIEWPGGDTFRSWTRDAPIIWLTKKRETTLDFTRSKLALGVGVPNIVEHVETHTVSSDAPATFDIVPQDDDGADAWGFEDPAETEDAQDEDDGADAWGWGDEETAASTVQTATHSQVSNNDQADRKVTFSEHYSTSSIPFPLYEQVTGIYEEAAKLAQTDKSPIAKAVTGIFALPTLVLAMYRAVSPYYYSVNSCGNMYIYNDTTWLCDKFKEFSVRWQTRETQDQLPPNIVGKVKLEPEIKALESFGKRAYAAEMTRQRRIIDDFLGGTLNFFEEGEDQEKTISSVKAHIHTTASLWSKILPPSALSYSIGSLVNKLASKIITDTIDLGDINTDLAQLIANIISSVVELDELFTEPQTNGNNDGEKPLPQTAKFADKWMKFQFLGEVLQSNLPEIRYLWFESDLSIWMTKAEVLDLIQASFADNALSRRLKKDIQESEVHGT